MKSLLVVVSFLTVCKCTEVCYGYLECFTPMPVLKLPLLPLPDSPEKIDTRFDLFTAESPSVPVLIEYNETTVQYPRNENPEKLFFLFHGFNGGLFAPNETDSSFGLMTKLLLSVNPNSNVIFVDMSKGIALGSYLLYPKAAANLQVAGRVAAVFIKNLLSLKNLSPSVCHLIGHSLGAHAAAYTGQWFQHISNGIKLGRITGLDSAGPLFEETLDDDYRLSKDDAEFVDSIHTNAGFFGIIRPVGFVDIYVNGGVQQPACAPLNTTCNHAIVREYFNYSINRTCTYTAYHCKNFSIPLVIGLGCETTCQTPCGTMGYYSEPATSYGIMVSNTTASSPYC